MKKIDFSRIIPLLALTGALFAVVLVSGCIFGDKDSAGWADVTRTPAPDISGNEAIYDCTWVLKAVYDSENDEMIPAGDVMATLVLGKDGKLSGNSGCNNFFGDYELNGDVFEAGLLGSTKMACFDKNAALIESKFLENLDKATSISYKKDNLAFYDSDKKLLLEFEKFYPENYKWELVSLNTGDAVVSVPANTTVTMSFYEGRMTGSAGCNSYFAEYSTDGISMITTSLVGSTAMYCMNEDIMQTESAYLSLLEDVEGYSFYGDILTFTDGDGKTLLKYTRIS